MPGILNPHAIFTLALTGLALYLFARDRLPLEASSLAILIALIVAFQLFPYEANGARLDPAMFLAGFGNEALITIAALLIMGKGLETTGALHPVAVSLARAWTTNPRLASLFTLLIAGVTSGFVNDTPVVVMLLPMLISVAARNKFAPSSILMPVGFVTLMGGMATTIGTSTNLLIVSIAENQGVESFGIFDFTLPAVIVGLVGILFLWFIGPKLLPTREPPLSDRSPREFDAVFHIDEDSACCGQTLAQCLAATDNQMRVERIQRGERILLARLPSVRILAGDRLMVRDTPERLKDFEARLGADLHDPTAGEGPFPPEREEMAEIVVTRGSLLHRSTVTNTRFAERTGLLPLAVHRARATDDKRVTSHIGLVPLRAGDVLLVQGAQRDLEQLKRSGLALVLDGTVNLPRTHRANTALALMALVVLSAAFGLVPISVSAVTGVGLMLATRCLAWRDVGKALPIPVIMIIVASLALGHALIDTGAAAYVAGHFVGLVHALPTAVILSALMLTLAILNNFVHTTAAGVIGAPIAIQIAHQLGAPPEAFVLAVIFGANMSFATPFGHQANLLVLTAGGYKVSDFARLGIPLTLLMWLGFSLVLPMLYPL